MLNASYVRRAFFGILLFATLALSIRSAGAQSTSVFAYLSYSGVSVFDTDTKANTGSMSSSNALFLETTPGGAYLYVVENGADTVGVFETATNTRVATVPVGDQAIDIAITPDGNFAYVTDRHTGDVTVIQTSDNSVVTAIDAGDYAFGIAITPDGQLVYVANEYSDTVTVIETASNTVVSTIASADFSSPTMIAITPDGQFAYVTNFGAGVAIIETATNTVVANVSVGNSPFGVDVTPDGNFVYVANYHSNDVSVIRTSDNTVVATVPTTSGGTWLRDLAITPDGQFAYVAVQTSGRTEIISTATNTVVDTISGGGYGIAFTNVNAPASGGGSSTGCYINAPESADEDTTFTVTVQCDDVDGMYGFQFGTTLGGDGSTEATGYTAGDFENNAFNAVLEVSNTLALFSQSYTGNDVSDGSYSLGSYDVTADKYLLADGAITVSLDDFLASDSSGAALAALADAPDATITVNDIILTLLQGNVTIASDGTTTNLSNAVLTVDGTSYDAVSGAGSSVAVAVDQEGNLLDIAISADMDGHLSCSQTVTIPDGSTDAATSIGAITLLAGDVVSVDNDAAINLQDAVAVGAAFGGAASGQEDINGDGTVNVLDLVHIGRNYDTTSAACVDDSPATYEVGDIHPDGGIVFAVDEAGTSGWIVQAADFGRFNFADMVAAAQAEGNGWTAPEITQLTVIYDELHVARGIGDFQAEKYRSVTSSGYPQYPWAKNFANGVQEGDGLANETLVRLVKQFAP